MVQKQSFNGHKHAGALVARLTCREHSKTSHSQGHPHPTHSCKANENVHDWFLAMKAFTTLTVENSRFNAFMLKQQISEREEPKLLVTRLQARPRV